jgi:ADP-ribosylglycohydrolase
MLLLSLLLLLQHNQSSQSNGCLMRVTPLAVWAHQQPVDVIAQHAMDETALTHPNKIAQVRFGGVLAQKAC